MPLSVLIYDANNNKRYEEEDIKNIFTYDQNGFKLAQLAYDHATESAYYAKVGLGLKFNNFLKFRFT